MSFTSILSRIGYWERASIALSIIFVIYAILSLKYARHSIQKVIASVVTFGALLFCTFNVWIDYKHVYMILGPIGMNDPFYRNQAWHDILFSLGITLLITLPILTLGWTLALKSQGKKVASQSAPLISVKKEEKSGDIY